MIRKDCDKLCFADGRKIGRRPGRVTGLALKVALALFALAVDLHAGSVRLWPSAVVVGDSVKLSDVCELTGFDGTTEVMLAELVLSEAPAAGGSRVIPMNLVRSSLISGGANMATLTVKGATHCQVSRPSNMVTKPVSAKLRTPNRGSRGSTMSPAEFVANPEARPDVTLRQAVIDYFNSELARYGGKADVVFDHTSEQVLDLSGPAYEFRVRRRSSLPVGLIQIEVDVLARGGLVQSVPLVTRVSLTRRSVVARRAINQDVTIQPSDVELVPLSYTRLDKLGLNDLARAIGQRAKRFVAAGSLVELGMLESVPLVVRGQLVTMISNVGGVRVVSTGKVLRDGLLGETITVRSVNKKRVEFDAVVTGPGVVRVGPGPTVTHDVRYALGGGS